MANITGNKDATTTTKSQPQPQPHQSTGQTQPQPTHVSRLQAGGTKIGGNSR